MTLYLPPRVEREIENERLDQQVDETLGYLKWFDRELKEINPNLSLVLAKDNSSDLKPGFWYVRNRIVDGPDTYMEITAGGRQSEPLGIHLERLREMSLRRKDGLKDALEKANQEAGERKRKAEQARAEMKDEFQGRLKAHFEPGVLFSDLKWRYRL